eukprot:16072-Heterococcus_DN1.PRE.1
MLRCPSPGCTSTPFTQRSVALHLSEETFAAYLRAWQQGVEQRATQAAAEQAWLEKEAQAALDAATRARAHIIDNIFTLKCLKCGKAFDAFTGCCALLCADTKGNGCCTSFCAFCLEIGTIATIHAHVQSCIYNTTRAVFGNVTVFETAQRARRQRLTHQYLDTLDSALRSSVLAAIETDLRGLGIDPAALRGPAPAGVPRRQQQQQQQPGLAGWLFGRLVPPAAVPAPVEPRRAAALAAVVDAEPNVEEQKADEQLLAVFKEWEADAALDAYQQLERDVQRRLAAVQAAVRLAGAEALQPVRVAQRQHLQGLLKK